MFLMQQCLLYIEAIRTGQTYRVQEQPFGIANISVFYKIMVHTFTMVGRYWLEFKMLIHVLPIQRK